MKGYVTTLILVVGFIKLYGQHADDGMISQDTVFIKQNKDWTADTLNYITDTVIFESGMRRHILTGTAILPQTHNSIAAQEYGLYFSKIKKSDCKHDGAGEFSGDHDHINSVDHTDSTLTIDLTLYDNCCYDFLCDISVDSTGTLHLLYSGYGTYCSCDCCFGLTYYLMLSKENETPELKSIMLNYSRKTLTSIKKKLR